MTGQWETRDTKVSSKQHNKVQHCLGCISFQLALMVRVSYSYKFWHKLRKHERDAKRELLPCWNSKLLSFVKSSHKNNHFANIKTNISLHTQTSGTHFRRVSPFNITPLKEQETRYSVPCIKLIHKTKHSPSFKRTIYDYGKPDFEKLSNELSNVKWVDIVSLQLFSDTTRYGKKIYACKKN